MKTIIFDFNGTIIDDLDLCFNILNKMLKENGLKEITLKRYLDIFDFPIKKYYQDAGFDFSKVSFEDLSVRFIDLYQQESLKCPLQKGFIETISKFKEMGYLLVCLSASQIDNLKEQLNHFKIASYFDKILGIDNIYAKSKTEIGVAYLKEMKLNPKDVIMFGDTIHDYEAAKKMGIKVCLYSKGHQSKERLLKMNVPVVDSYADFERMVLNDEI